MDDLVALIPTLVAKKNFTLDYISHVDLRGSSIHYLFGKDHYRVNITYDANMGNPILFTWDAATLSWKSSPIALTKRIEKK